MPQAFQTIKIVGLTRELTNFTRRATLKPNQIQFESKRDSTYCTKDLKEAEALRLKENKCPNKLCKPPPPPPKPGFWKRFFSCDEDELAKAARPPITICRKRLAKQEITSPDLSFIDGQQFRTCGEAYIVQKDLLPVKASETSRETRLVRKIERPLHCVLDAGEDPLDKITSAELRLIALHEKRLHPNYKKLDTILKQVPIPEPEDPCETTTTMTTTARTYNTISGPLDPNDIPVQLKFDRELLDRKNIMYDFKRVEPSRDLIAPIIEMRMNQRPTLEKKKRRYEIEQEEVHQSVDKKLEPMLGKPCTISTKSKSATFDTLHQGTILLDSMVQMGRKDRKDNVDTKADNNIKK